MFESGHARLLGAFVVAVAVHGLLFVGYAQHAEKLFSAPLQVEFLAQPRNASTASSKPINVHKPVELKNVSAVQPIISKKVVRKAEIHQQQVKPLKPMAAQKKIVEHVTKEAKAKIELAVLEDVSPPQEQQKGEDVDMVMPVNIQKKILTQVSYPVRARRRGWEGKAEFRINVRNQGVQHVTMLLSTGYDVLDHAAQKGIASMALLPLNDGSYRFPVVFHLQ
ncbi:MAG: TonB family protein [Mariprofundaceae bacterium]|nr:TonB family protein [Mariprofundaceae bacterium]